MWTCLVPGRGPLAVNLGSRCRLRGDPRGGDLERSCQGVGRVDSLRQSVRGIGVGVGPVRVRRYSGAGMARIAGKDRKTAEGWSSGGLLPPLDF